MVILGLSGSGRSTLLNIIGGLDTATSGTMRFRDHELTGAGEAVLTRFRRDHVGFVFQFYNLIPSLTAEENVALVTEIARRPPGRARLRHVVTGRRNGVLAEIREGLTAGEGVILHPSNRVTEGTRIATRS